MNIFIYPVLWFFLFVGNLHAETPPRQPHVPSKEGRVISTPGGLEQGTITLFERLLAALNSKERAQQKEAEEKMVELAKSERNGLDIRRAIYDQFINNPSLSAEQKKRLERVLLVAVPELTFGALAKAQLKIYRSETVKELREVADSILQQFGEADLKALKNTQEKLSEFDKKDANHPDPRRAANGKEEDAFRQIRKNHLAARNSIVSEVFSKYKNAVQEAKFQIEGSFTHKVNWRGKENDMGYIAGKKISGMTFVVKKNGNQYAFSVNETGVFSIEPLLVDSKRLVPRSLKGDLLGVAKSIQLPSWNSLMVRLPDATVPFGSVPPDQRKYQVRDLSIPTEGLSLSLQGSGPEARSYGIFIRNRNGGQGPGNPGLSPAPEISEPDNVGNYFSVTQGDYRTRADSHYLAVAQMGLHMARQMFPPIEGRDTLDLLLPQFNAEIRDEMESLVTGEELDRATTIPSLRRLFMGPSPP